MHDHRTVVFGIDGAHFELIEPWVEAGKLPNIEQVIETGVTADLESVLPPVTSPNWKAYATGKNPGKIGIFWWENIDVENERIHYPSERKHINDEFWELISEEEPVGVLGVPTTYPPKSVDSFLVAGAPDGEDTGFAHPPGIEDELRNQFDYRVTKNPRLKDDVDEAAAEILDLIDMRYRAAKHLLDEHDVSFLQVTTFYINSLHHFLWNHEYTLEAWQLIDEHLGDFLDDEHNVVLMSDHGSNEIQTVFHINSWLAREGYLALDSGVATGLHRLGINTDRLIRIATRLKVRDVAKRVTPQRLIDHIPDEQGEIKRGSKTDNVDWDRTTAIASGQGPIYLTTDRADPRYEQLREELITKLERLTGPNGRTVADAVVPGEEVYAGEFADEAPDIVIDQAKGVHIPGSIGRDEIFSVPDADGWRGENKRHGLFAATGPDIGHGRIENLSILDLAPTLLHLHGCAIPGDMDGTVRQSVFADDSHAANRAVEHRSVTPREREIRRIRQAARAISVQR
jgi:predicted AlkP superfamily phosphohydrolase/phosphomutase